MLDVLDVETARHCEVPVDVWLRYTLVPVALGEVMEVRIQHIAELGSVERSTENYFPFLGIALLAVSCVGVSELLDHQQVTWISRASVDRYVLCAVEVF